MWSGFKGNFLYKYRHLFAGYNFRYYQAFINPCHGNIPFLYPLKVVGIKAKGRISKRVFQENKARQIFRKTNISYPLIRIADETSESHRYVGRNDICLSSLHKSTLHVSAIYIEIAVVWKVSIVKLRFPVCKIKLIKPFKFLR